MGNESDETITQVHPEDVRYHEGRSDNEQTTQFENRTMTRTMHRKIPRIIPSKFVKGDFYESDYPSDIEDTRIKPKWVPLDSDTDSEPTYRPVRPQLKWKEPSTSASTVLKTFDKMGQEFAEKAGNTAEKFTTDLAKSAGDSRDGRKSQSGDNQEIVYFKYDFGYEVGVLVPKEGPPKDINAIEDGIRLPILHESTAKK